MREKRRHHLSSMLKKLFWRKSRFPQNSEIKKMFLLIPKLAHKNVKTIAPFSSQTLRENCFVLLKLPILAVLH